MNRPFFAAASTALALLTAGLAHAQDGMKIVRVEGRVVAVSEHEIALAKADGASVSIPLLANWSVRIAKPISVSEIQPGSYLGVTNHAKPDGTGDALEVHVSPPGFKGQGLDFVMDADAGTTMTNGVVGKVVQSGAGRVLTVDYGHGVRVITVPPGVPIVLTRPADRSIVTVGALVAVSNITRPSGMLQIVSVETQ